MTAIVLVALLLSSGSEVDRIQAHLEQVEAELRAADVSALGPQQRAHRERLIKELRAYRKRGVFPRNIEVPGRNPIFVDPWGVRCAMAHLIETTGHGGLVARIAATRNPAYIAELAGDSELIAWLGAHGLSAAEAARIQPTYDNQPVGAYCYDGERCASGICVRVDPQLGYCSNACDPTDASSCPVGMQDVAMTCPAPEGDEAAICRYPDPVPGGMGWPCADDPYACIGACLTDAPAPTCTYYCSTAAECPAAYDCQPRGDASLCIERVDDPGCAASGSAPGAPAAVMVLLLAALLRRRTRR